MTTPAPTGEEWRDMRAASQPANAALQDAILAQARAGIRAHRMGDLSLRLLDRAGQPLAGVPVRLQQTRHAFLFGDQLWALDAMYRHGEWDTDRARAWRQRFAEVLNAATCLCYWTERPHNDGAKTEDRQGEPRMANFAAMVDWARGAGLVAKGHPLFWSIPKCIPEWAKRYDEATFMKFAEVRVRSLVAGFRGRVSVWDAVNEALWEAAPRHLAQRQWPHIEPLPELLRYLVPVLQWCRDEDPAATFLINDYGTELADTPRTGHDGSVVTGITQRRRYLALLRALADAGVAPHAAGLQAHTSGWATPAQQWALYDEFAVAGFPVHITEFWAEPEELRDAAAFSPAERIQLQANYIGNYLTTAFGHPNVDAFFFWGFMKAAVHWVEGNRSSHDTTPVYDTVRRLLHEEWHTDERLVSDADGVVHTRAFYGDYDLTPLAPVGGGGLRFSLARGSAAPHTLTAPPGWTTQRPSA